MTLPGSRQEALLQSFLLNWVKATSLACGQSSKRASNESICPHTSPPQLFTDLYEEYRTSFLTGANTPVQSFKVGLKFKVGQDQKK